MPAPVRVPKESSGTGDYIPQKKKPGPYLLGPMDGLRIIVEDQPDYTFPDIVVRPDGSLNLPKFGSVKADGLTVLQLQSELRRRIKKWFRHPERLTVTLTRPRIDPPDLASVLGNAVKAGRPDVGDGTPLTDVLAMVGGIATRPDQVKATLTRPGKSQITIDLAQALAQPQSKANITIYRDDVLTIDQIDPETITINGDVARPGTYAMRKVPSLAATAYEISLKPSFAELIAEAGGLRDPTPATPIDFQQDFTGFLMRDGKKSELRVLDAVLHRDDTANIPLKAGDTVYVSAVEIPALKVTIDGQVKNPGTIEIDEGSGVLQAIAKAGGLSQPPDTVVTSIARGGKSISVDLVKAAFDPQANIPLVKDDLIMVREPEIVRVSFAGNWTKTAPLRLPVGSRLLDAVAAVGGLTSKPEWTRIALSRVINGEPKILTVDPTGLLNQELSQNVLLQDQDFVTATDIEPAPPKRKMTVFISGEVAKPSYYDMEQGLSLADAITVAGGPNKEAALTQVKVVRADGEHTVDMYDAVINGAKGLDFKLQDNDRIVVPKNNNRVLVWDAVNHSGTVLIPERGAFTVLEAINQAGGFKDYAKTKEIAVLHPIGKGQYSQTNIEMAKGLPSSLAPLQNGDIVYVPQGKAPKSPMSTLAPMLGILGFLR
jgi:protein involved in polysaccharide export with SLBB domain